MPICPLVKLCRLNIGGDPQVSASTSARTRQTTPALQEATTRASREAVTPALRHAFTPATIRRTISAAVAAATLLAISVDNALAGTDFENQRISLPDSTKDAAKTQSSSSGAAVRMILGLLFVLGLIFVVNKLLKHYNKGKFAGSSASNAGAMEIVATTQLSTHRSLHLVRIGDEIVMIGATDGGITHLKNIDPQKLMYAQEGTAMNTADPAFSDALTKAMTDGTKSSTFFGRFVTNLQLMTAR